MPGLLILLLVYALVAPAIAIAIALSGRARERELEHRLRRAEHRLGLLIAGRAAPWEEELDEEAVDEAPHAEPTPTEDAAPRSPAPPEPLPSQLTPEPIPAAAATPTEPSITETITPLTPPQRRPRPARPSLEHALGKRATTIVGAVALALGIVFLVRHSILQGWWPAWLRVAAGTAASAAALVATPLLRRTYPFVADALAAAGVAGLYACLFVAHTVYSWIPPAPTFALLAVHTLLAVVLSQRHGPIVALLGLAGGFSMPGFIATEQPAPYVLVAYLLALQAGLQIVVRRSGWWLLGAVTFGAGLLWVFALVQQPSDAFPRPLLGLLLLGSLLLEKLGVQRDAPVPALQVSVAGTMFGLIAAIALLVESGFRLDVLPFTSASIAGVLLLARLDLRMAVLAWLALAASLGLIACATDESTVGDGLLLALAGGHWALLVVFAAIALVRRGAPDPPAEFAAVATLALLALLRFLRPEMFAAGEFGLLAALTAVPFAAGAFAMQRHDPAAGTAGVLALGAVVLALFAAAVELELTSLGALAAAGAALCLALERIVRTRYGIPLALLLVACAVALQGVTPFIAGRTHAPSWLFNRLVAEQALGILALACAWRIARGWREDLLPPLRVTTLGALLWFGLLLIRLWFHPGDPRAGSLPLVETAAQAILLWAFPFLLRFAGARAPSVLAAAVPALVHAGLLLLFARNPLLVPLPVGDTPVVNLLLPLWALPALAAAGLARDAARGGRRELAAFFGGTALLLGWLWLTGTIRQCFAGSVIRLGEVGIAESFTWSIGWLIAAILLLIAGMRRQIVLLRRTALVLLAITTCKVFLADTSHLEGLWRVLSFLGLGVALLGIGALYQRLEQGEAQRAELTP